MKTKRRILLFLMAAAALSYGLIVFQKKSGVQENSVAPNFTLPVYPPAQGTIDSLESYRGQVVLVNFWATWCPTCRDEIPSLERLQKQLEGQPFQILAISVDEEGAPAIDRFKTRYPLSLRVLLDPSGTSANLYGTYQLPESYLVDQKGEVIRKYVGGWEWDDAETIKEIMSYVQKS